jgi:hypothetical protein
MAVVKQTITIDEMQGQIEKLRSALIGLARFVGGDPCWCRCDGGKHSEACRVAYALPLWRSPSGISLPWKEFDTKETLSAIRSKP